MNTDKILVICSVLVLVGCNHRGTSTASGSAQPAVQQDGRANASTTKSLAIAESNIYQVGPGKKYSSLQQVAALLHAGDTVYVDGNTTWFLIFLRQYITAI